MTTHEITVYFDYKSPFAYLGKDPAYEVERDFGVRLTWLPYTLDIPSYLDSVQTRSDKNWLRVRYAYMDARRWANKRGLLVRGPKKIFDSSIANIGMLYAVREGAFREYHDTVYERFWKRELEIEDPEVIRAVLEEAGADTGGFQSFLEGEGRREHDRIRAEAEERGVFGVPTYIFEGELFWGHDRVPLLRERLSEAGG
ncbi:MAG: DsbA family protein [SAR324 cluster bacterium]|nr:DsbA family protein [SAR324 cluster bacterium]